MGNFPWNFPDSVWPCMMFSVLEGFMSLCLSCPLISAQTPPAGGPKRPTAPVPAAARAGGLSSSSLLGASDISHDDAPPRPAGAAAASARGAPTAAPATAGAGARRSAGCLSACMHATCRMQLCSHAIVLSMLMHLETVHSLSNRPFLESSACLGPGIRSLSQPFSNLYISVQYGRTIDFRAWKIPRLYMQVQRGRL